MKQVKLFFSPFIFRLVYRYVYSLGQCHTMVTLANKKYSEDYPPSVQKIYTSTFIGFLNIAMTGRAKY